jgi:hypothetical protein
MPSAGHGALSEGRLFPVGRHRRRNLVGVAWLTPEEQVLFRADSFLGKTTNGCRSRHLVTPCLDEVTKNSRYP